MTVTCTAWQEETSAAVWHAALNLVLFQTARNGDVNYGKVAELDLRVVRVMAFAVEPLVRAADVRGWALTAAVVCW